jgi:D-beta-D-heptose 7-phosphate kinase/D-beta-D-heptose 1-phosphate adenosyltransferase
MAERSCLLRTWWPGSVMTGAASDYKSLLEGLSTVSVLVIGDVMLDEYIWGDVRRISPEAPVPVVEFRSSTEVLGGAANAAANVASLNAKALLGGVVGRDREAEALRHQLTECGILTHLVTSIDRPTTTKTRVIGGSQQILRIDREECHHVSRDTESSLLEWVTQQLQSADCLLVSDYGKGIVTPELCARLIHLARETDKPIVVDPKGRDYSKYSGATVVTPNVREVHLAAEPHSLSSGELEDDVRTLQSVLEGASVLVTRGSDGVSLFRIGRQTYHIPARRRNVFDVTGAGDTLAATLALGLGSGASLEESAAIANAAGGVVVGKVGTGRVNRSELELELSKQGGAPEAHQSKG